MWLEIIGFVIFALLLGLQFPMLKMRNKYRDLVEYDKNGILLNTFETAREAAKFLGEIQLNSHINSCCNNKRKTCKGFIWKYKEETR